MALGVSSFAGAAYWEGDLLFPLMALLLAAAIPLFLYDDPAKRRAFALLTSALVSGLALLTLKLGGRVTGIPVLGLSVAAVSVPIGLDLILQDFGKRLDVHPSLARVAVWAFIVAVLPVSVFILVQEHHTMVQEDNVLIRAVAQNVTPQGNTIVFDQVDLRQKDKLQRRVSVRARNQTYSLADADIESVTEEYPLRRKGRRQGQSAAVSWEQTERMRMILRLQGMELPEDIVLFSHRGPITVSELRISLEKKDG